MENQDIKSLIQKAIDQGWTVESVEGRVRFIPPEGRMPVRPEAPPTDEPENVR